METSLTLSDGKLRELAAECDKRRERLATRDGQEGAAQEMLRLFEYLEASGYKMPLRENRLTVARVWSEQLAECIVTYGFKVIRQAVKEFVENDEREFRQAPNAIDIKAICRSQGFNPKRALALRKLEEDEKRRKDEANRIANEWIKRQSPERLEEIKRCIERTRES